MSSSITLRICSNETRGAASRSAASFACMRSWNSGGKAPVSMNDATWPTFIAAPFIWPSTSTICSAACSWRRSAAAWRAVGAAREVGRLGGVVARRLAAGELAHLGGAAHPALGNLVGHLVQGTRVGAARLRPAMRLVSYDSGAGPRAALLRDGRVLDLAGEPRTLEAILAAGAARRGRTGLSRTGAALEDVTLLPPLSRPGKIVCIGLNYRAHAEEQGIEPPEMPTFFAKFATSLVPAGATVPLPSWSRRRGLRGRGGVRDRSRAARTSPRPTRSTTSPATRCSTTSRRATTRSRRRSGCRARRSTARRRSGPRS